MGGIVSYAWLMSFVIILSYPLLTSYFGSHSPFFMYGTVNLLGALFCGIFLIETKGKSDEEIREMLAGGEQKSKN